ncbi:hypothetical protein Tco_0356135, partial [Tanacetum coccineum]
QPSSSSQPKKDKPSKKAQRQEVEIPQDEAKHKESVPTPSNDPQPSGEDSIVPGTFQGYETSEEDSVERPRRRNRYGFVDHPQLQ